MRILILADIHANWPALQAVQEPHDVCLFVGDLVDYALEPAPCIEWVDKHVHYGVRGNHDHAVAQGAVATGPDGFKYLSGVTRQLTWERLEPQHLRSLGKLPVTRMVTLNKVRFFLVHATPRDPLEESAPNDPEFWARRLKNVQADVICVGHTHQPYVLTVGNQIVVNAGSVGQPRDGDPRASYAVWEDGKVEIKRVEYPVEDVVKTIEASSLPELAKRMSIEVFRTGSGTAATASRFTERDGSPEGTTAVTPVPQHAPSKVKPDDPSDDEVAL